MDASHIRNTMNILLFSIAAIFWIAGVIVMVKGVSNAPEAYQDERGFHFH